MNKSAATILIALSVALMGSGVAVPLLAAPPGKAFVANSNDDGPGSFRAAISEATADPGITRIQFLGGVSIISLQQTIWFTGPQELTIDGNGVTLHGADAAGPAFRATGGGNLIVSHLTVRDAPAEGITVDVPHFATGTIKVSLFNVDIRNNAGHGVLVDDQDDPATGVLDGDSDASVHVSVVNSLLFHNGYSVSDRDGLR